MTAKKPARKKAPASVGADEAQAIERLKDDVVIPDGPLLKSDDERFSAIYERILPRVHRWVKESDSEEVAMSLAMSLLVGRMLDREMMFLCETLALDRATIKHSAGKRRAGRRSQVYLTIKTHWLAWQKDPSLYAGTGAFKRRMELDYPGAHAGTIANWITEWKGES